MISFAGGGPNTRGTDLFVTWLTGNANGTPRAPWETPFGIIDASGLEAMARFGGTGDLGEGSPRLEKGYDALKTSHPDIDYLGTCRLVPRTDMDTTSSPAHVDAAADSAMSPRRPMVIFLGLLAYALALWLVFAAQRRRGSKQSALHIV